MGKIKLQNSDLQVGKALKWTIFDSEGHLLFKPGAIIASQLQVESLLTRGAFRNDDSDNNDEQVLADTPEPRSNKFTDSTAIKVATSLLRLTPFDILHNIFQRLRTLFESIENNPVQISTQTAAIAKIIIQLFKKDREVMIGAIRLMHEYDYTLCHPIHSSILSALMGARLKYGYNKQIRLICATLTQNISMNALQEQLQEQDERPFEEQQLAIESHPSASAMMLSVCGVTDEKWLNIIQQHHERPDGNGYPDKISQEDILEEAMIIGLADRYSAMLSGRLHRKGMNTEEVIKVLGKSRNKDCDEKLTMLLIGTLGVYPPGSFVKLKNGETAIVIRRTTNPKLPIVSSYVDPLGAPFKKPIIRDLSAVSIEITGHTEPDTLIPIDLNTIWGF